MALNITRKFIDECRLALKEAEPYTEEEIFDGSEESDGARRKATYSKNILQHLGLSLTDPDDYGDIKE